MPLRNCKKCNTLWNMKDYVKKTDWSFDLCGKCWVERGLAEQPKVCAVCEKQNHIYPMCAHTKNHGICADCLSERYYKYKSHIKHFRERNVTLKINCRECLEDKGVKNYCDSELARYQNNFTVCCKECRAERKAAWMAVPGNRERVNANKTKYRRLKRLELLQLRKTNGYASEKEVKQMVEIQEYFAEGLI